MGGGSHGTPASAAIMPVVNLGAARRDGGLSEDADGAVRAGGLGEACIGS
jgi:hypothetical protein